MKLPGPLRYRNDTITLPPPIIWAPALAIGGLLLLSPVYLALRSLGAGYEFWDALLRPRALEILLRTLLLVVTVTVASVGLAVPLAWLTARTDLPLARFWAVVTALPLVMPSYVAGFAVVVALGPRGMLQGFLESMVGLQRLPDINGFPGAMMTLTLLSYPYVMLTVRSALLRLDPSLEESSLGLGYGWRATFRKVVLPLLRPAISAGALLVALYTLSDFGAVSLLRYETFTWAIFVQYETALDRTLGAAFSLVLVVLAVGFLLLEYFTRGRSRYYRVDQGAPRPARKVPLGAWRWPAVGFCLLVTLTALFLPVSVLVYWVIRGVLAGEPLLLLWADAASSLYVSGLAAGAAVLAALPVAVYSVRYPGLFSSLLERVTYVGFALPGIAVALGLVFFGANYARFFYQSIVMLVLAYVVLFLPTAVGAARTSLLQVPPRLEEAGRSLGKTPIQVFSSVTLPLLRPGLVSGAALVFLLSMKELPATLMLRPGGFSTLATSVWSAASEAFFAQAAAPALLLVLVAAAPLAFLMLRDGRPHG